MLPLFILYIIPSQGAACDIHRRLKATAPFWSPVMKWMPLLWGVAHVLFHLFLPYAAFILQSPLRVLAHMILRATRVKPKIEMKSWRLRDTLFRIFCRSRRSCPKTMNFKKKNSLSSGCYYDRHQFDEIEFKNVWFFKKTRENSSSNFDTEIKSY